VKRRPFNAIARPKDPLARGVFERLCASSEGSNEDAAVYADWLTERGSTLGEHIVLSRAGRRREAEALWERDRLDWLGRLGPVLQPHGLEFASGLPQLAVIRELQCEAAVAAARYAEWLLFKEPQLPVQREAPLIPLLTSPALANLRAMSRLRDEEVGDRPGRARSRRAHHAARRRERSRAAIYLSAGGPEVAEHRGGPAMVQAICCTPVRLKRIELGIIDLGVLVDEAVLSLQPNVDELAIYSELYSLSSDFEAAHRVDRGLRLALTRPQRSPLEARVGAKFASGLPSLVNSVSLGSLE